MADVFNNLDLVLLQRQLFKQVARIKALNLDNIVIHQVELPQVHEHVEVLDDGDLLVSEVEEFQVLFPVLLSVIMVLVGFSGRALGGVHAVLIQAWRLVIFLVDWVRFEEPLSLVPH